MLYYMTVLLWLQYHHLLHVLLDPEVPSSKRTWESRMYHARAILRGAFVCEEEGDRRVLHNYILKTHEMVLIDRPSLRMHIQDPADDCSDSDW